MAVKKSFIFFVTLFSFSVVSGQQKSGLERLIDKGYSIIEGDTTVKNKKYFFVLPIWGTYPETGWRFGLSIVQLFHTNYDSITRPSLIRLNTQYTQFHQFSIRPYADIYFKQNLYNLKAVFTFTRFSENYFGVGNNTLNSDKESYGFSLNKLNIRTTKQLKQGLYFGPQLQFEHMFNIDYAENSLLKNSTVTGHNGSFTMGLGMVLAYDTRNQVYFPSKGYYLEISNLFNRIFLGSEFENSSFLFDARKFIQLWKENILGLQIVSNLNYGETPFRQMGAIGNDMIMRGYYNGRFRDQHMFAAQAEFRKKIWGPASMVFFGGFGNVGKNSADLFSSLKPNYGIGLRGLVIRKEKINLRIDYGRGENGINGLYFTMGEAF